MAVRMMEDLQQKLREMFIGVHERVDRESAGTMRAWTH